MALLVPVPQPARLATACAAVGIAGHVVPTAADGGRAPCLVVLAEPAASGTAVQRLSRVLGRAELVVLRRADGRLEAERWQRGRMVDTPAAGLLVQGLPDVVSSLLVGGTEPESVVGAVEIRAGRGAGHGQAPGSSTADDRAARRRRLDRLSSWVVVAVLSLLAVTETVRAAAGGGSWLVVVGAAGVALLVVWRAVRLRGPTGGRTAPDATPPPS